MALKWVKALQAVTRTNDAGDREKYMPGDWFQARNMEIRRLIAAGKVAIYEDTSEAGILDLEGCGVVTNQSRFTLEGLSIFGRGLEITHSPNLILKYPYTMFYGGGKLRKELIPTTFELLRSWDCAIPFESFEIIAKNIGTQDDRDLTLEVIGDLRVPVYNTKQMYIKRGPDTIKLMAAWGQEKSKIDNGTGDERLAFLRALYVNPLLILALPPSWVTGIKSRSGEPVRSP